MVVDDAGDGLPTGGASGGAPGGAPGGGLGGAPGGGLADAVLACVRAIPVGRVMTYGDVAEYVGTRAARNVGRILATYHAEGPPVPWHRVLRADGSCAEHIRGEQLARLRSEGVPITGDRVDLARCRWDGR